MEYTYTASITLPASYLPLSEEEMVYVDGGAVSPEYAKAFGLALANTLVLFVGKMSFNGFYSFISNAMTDVNWNTTKAVVKDALDPMSTLQKSLLVGFGATAVYYFGNYLYDLYQSLMSSVSASSGAQQGVFATSSSSTQTGVFAAA